MVTTSSDEARIHWAELLDNVRSGPVHINRRGRAVAVLVDPDFYERALEALEDVADLAAARAARENNEPLVSHEDLKRELGIDV